MRSSIYYWKCDRPSAEQGLPRNEQAGWPHLPDLSRLLQANFPGPISLHPAGGKGNHHTFLMDSAGGRTFVRVEDGPEQDEHLAVESRVIVEVGRTGLPVPAVLFTDVSRSKVPFAVQVIEYFDCPDLNMLHREGRLPLERIAIEIGRSIARWQQVPVSGFGPFEPSAAIRDGFLVGFHRSYPEYFRLQLDRHLGLLIEDDFLTESEASDIEVAIGANASLLALEDGCLVHKDLALWNIMGTEGGVRAFIDWDDAVAGDPTDDLSLLACFHPATVVQAAVEGYAMIKPLPSEFVRRFWLHLLRNMIVKAVIRCRSGYFRKEASGAFLMSPDQSGPDFREFSRKKLLSALSGLRCGHALENL